MSPTTLLLAPIVVVTPIEVAYQMALELALQNALDYLVRATRIVLVVTHPGLSWGRKAPNIPIPPVLSPTRLIRVQYLARLSFRLQLFDCLLRVLLHLVQQFHDLPAADSKQMQCFQISLNPPNGQAHSVAQVGDETG